MTECSKWAVNVALHYEKIGNNPERISKYESYIVMKINTTGTG